MAVGQYTHRKSILLKEFGADFLADDLSANVVFLG